MEGHGCICNNAGIIRNPNWSPELREFKRFLHKWWVKDMVLVLHCLDSVLERQGLSGMD